MHLCYDDATFYCPTVDSAMNSIYCHDNCLHLIDGYSTVIRDQSDRTTAVLCREAVFGAYDVVPPSNLQTNDKKKQTNKRTHELTITFCSEFNELSHLELG